MLDERFKTRIGRLATAAIASLLFMLFTACTDYQAEFDDAFGGMEYADVSGDPISGSSDVQDPESSDAQSPKSSNGNGASSGKTSESSSSVKHSSASSSSIPTSSGAEPQSSSEAAPTQSSEKLSANVFLKGKLDAFIIPYAALSFLYFISSFNK